MEILIGTNDLKSGGTYYKIKQYIAHERHNRPRFAYDIAVIEVSKTIKFNEKVQPIEYSREEISPGSVSQLTGWGRLSTSGPIPQMLQAINLTIVSTEKCRQLLGSVVHDSHICTYTKTAEGACLVSLFLDNCRFFIRTNRIQIQ